jgi:tellurite resistance protein
MRTVSVGVPPPLEVVVEGKRSTVSVPRVMVVVAVGAADGTLDAEEEDEALDVPELLSALAQRRAKSPTRIWLCSMASLVAE